MKVLLIGGTGAMGAPLQRYLSDLGCKVIITSRKDHTHASNKNIRYICGNAHDEKFINEVLLDHFDVIVDFMVYSVEEFSSRAELLLRSTDQYIFISSARVYSYFSEPITEEHPRLLDVCKDDLYLNTDEYALSKARQENVLLQGHYKNYTIVRPSLTYNSERLQYALGEKELWLYRYIHNEKVVFPESMDNVVNTMSYGDDVANAISLLVGNKKAIGEVIHIAGAEAITWGEVNRIYNDVLQERYNRELYIYIVDDWKHIGHVMGSYYQLKYARSVDRRFDNSKLQSIIGNISFMSPEQGLKKCLNEFLSGEMLFSEVNWKNEAYFNRITGDKGYTEKFSVQNRIKYTIGRYTPFFDLRYSFNE